MSERLRTELRDHSSWWDHFADRVELVVLRRVDRASGGWLEVRNAGATKEAALAEYERYCGESAERAGKDAQRRSHWGPRELRPRR